VQITNYTVGAEPEDSTQPIDTGLRHFHHLPTSEHTSLRSILMLSSHLLLGLPSGVYKVFPPKFRTYQDVPRFVNTISCYVIVS